MSLENRGVFSSLKNAKLNQAFERAFLATKKYVYLKKVEVNGHFMGLLMLGQKEN